MSKCYQWVRDSYGVPAYVDRRVLTPKGYGRIARKVGSQQYVYVLVDGEKHATPWHPTDIQYPEGLQ